ncbi:NADH:flavin oxidoreductase/NADH oxidase family protein [Marinomonas balearica]|uniref:2,4-dienoyl-CoA reductase-like NADH-dependent reductase (Old Yellow Enzyme family) n=1 Tax=Marinomonas balearica TaxID=491947 RepID=A0A4R6MDH2_9GAMM|nr:NADH:flavin oxidoreductase/NADH oxidase family protein [Marinomonas balearica]TDO99761.1 2,4-dienoyl-CoA reductase-like NADH-dependent reductase (Old Yellow Enzyme family) [Marinomonas balearica]
MTTTPQSKSIRLLYQPLCLPCGTVLKNRIVKSAMSDCLGDGEGNATEAQARLYERWALGGVGLALIGEAQILPDAPESPANLVLNAQTDIESLQRLTKKASTNQMHIWPQLGHAGCLSAASITPSTKGPSALELPELQCDALSNEEIQNLPKQYANAALIAQKTGFTGVQIHAGHGFLLSQFLSPLFNRRQDEYGGSIENRLWIIIQIIEKVRASVGPNFPIGIKINSSDQLEGGLTQQDSLCAIRLLDKTSLDLIEISGGSYFPGAESSSDKVSSGPYFVEFAKQAKYLTSIPIVVTGGFKNRQQAIDALANESTDAVGLARALALNPQLANDWKNTDTPIKDPEFPSFRQPPPGGITAWYTQRLTDIATSEYITTSTRDQTINLTQAIDWLKKSENVKSEKWKKHFGMSEG